MCVGYIGGKTQTDIATMDDLYLDGQSVLMHRLYQLSLMLPLALGITDENDLLELKGTKKKKGKKIDDPDFMVSWRYFSYWIAGHLVISANHATDS